MYNVWNFFISKHKINHRGVDMLLKSINLKTCSIQVLLFSLYLL